MVSMHLLVPGAFRRGVWSAVHAQRRCVSMHLLVPGAFRPASNFLTEPTIFPVSMHLLVLGAFRLEAVLSGKYPQFKSQCTFWCLVLSDPAFAGAYKDALSAGLNAPSGAWCFPTANAPTPKLTYFPSQCTFWCLVLSDGDATGGAVGYTTGSQCTFWCLVLSDLKEGIYKYSANFSLNAPSGAWCFPTERNAMTPEDIASLNAPSGAWCFPTEKQCLSSL